MPRDDLWLTTGLGICADSNRVCGEREVCTKQMCDSGEFVGREGERKREKEREREGEKERQRERGRERRRKRGGRGGGGGVRRKGTMGIRGQFMFSF